MAAEGLWRPRLAVLGAGDYGRALATRAATAGYDVCLGTRRPHENRSLQHKTGARVCSSEEATASCDVIAVCVPFDFYSKLPLKLMDGKVVIDISNSSWKKIDSGAPSNAEDLQALCPTANVVKGFNVLSAYALENNLQGGKKVFISGDQREAKKIVSQLISDLGFTPSNVGALRAARKIERIPLQLFPSWRTAVSVTIVVFLLLWLYSAVKSQVCTTLEANQLWDASLLKSVLMKDFNKALAMTATTILAASRLPGVLADYVLLWRGTKYRALPGWLARWQLSCRQLALVATALAAAHGVISITMSSPFYLTRAYDQPAVLLANIGASNTSSPHRVTVFNRLRQGRAEFGLTAGATSLCLLALAAVTSLPDVLTSLSQREVRWSRVILSWSALAAAALHNIALGWDFLALNYSCNLPSTLQVGLYLPAVALLLQLPLMVPAISQHLRAIKAGFQRAKVHPE